MKYIMSLDQGTTSSRAIIFNEKGESVCCAQKPFNQIFPQSGWVEHDPMEIWNSQREVAEEALRKLVTIAHSGEREASESIADCAAIGITNQRETTVVWEAATGKPVYNAIVWQDRRTSSCCNELAPHEEMIRHKTGLLPDPYFSASKIQWILRNVPGARQKADRGELRFGTIDSWLLWNLTEGKVHATDVSNASRTMLLNINTLDWDNELLALFDIPRSMLPEVVDSSAKIGIATSLDNAVMSSGGKTIPICSMIGDQQAALFGQLCTKPGDMKNTYGTGCFLLMNTGTKPVLSQNRLLTTVAWRMNGKTEYALEGSVFVGGSAVQWVRDGLGIIKNSCDIEALATSVPDNGGCYFVPALTGLGAPYWDSEARGIICGISRGTTAAHIARATLEGIAFQVMDIASAMEKDAGVKINSLKVDGGASVNDFLMQTQADLIDAEVVRPQQIETTALGAAFAAGLAAGLWKDTDQLKDVWKESKKYSPVNEVNALKAGWRDAVSRCCNNRG